MRPTKYVLILVGTLVAFVAFEYYKPKPINWNPTYQNTDKIPFGTQAVYELLPGLVGQSSVITTRLPPFNLLRESKLPAKSNYISVSETVKASALDTRELLAYAAKGNTVFLSAYSFSDTLSKALGFKASLKNPLQVDSTLRSNFVLSSLAKRGGYNFRHDDGRNFLELTRPNPLVTVLARNARKEAIFLKIRHGKGQFFIHNIPLAFTNYYLLTPASSDYMAKAFSYLPTVPTYWDEYQKKGRFDEEEQSILRFIRKQPALNWAYFTAILGLMAYMLFAGKRVQRVIPVVEPPKNTSLEFVNTVGQLYFQQGNHDNVARKKINFFLTELRDQYSLNTQQLNAEFVEILARKSDVPVAQVQELVRILSEAKRAVSLSEFDLLTINAAIENFRTESTSRVSH